MTVDMVGVGGLRVGGDGGECPVGADEEVVVAAVAGGDELDGAAGAACFVGRATKDGLADVLLPGAR